VAIDVRRSSDVRIILTSRVTEIAGRVREGNQPVAGVPVLVFPEDQTKWTFPSRFVAVGNADDQGRFAIRRLPPG
jgi:hypothetical protein